LHGRVVNMADGVGTGSHGGPSVGSSRVCPSDAVLAGAALTRSSAAGRLTAVAWARGGRRRLMELLLVTQQQVAPGEASRALRALKRLLLCVGTLVAFQVLQSGKGTLAGCADVRAGLIGFWWGEVGGSFCVDGDGRGS
jgi:hypothetical protein